MRFKTRLIVAMAATVLLPSILLAWIVRENMTAHLTTQYDDRGSALATTVSSRLIGMSQDIDGRLAVLTESALVDDNLRAGVAALDGGLPLFDDYLTAFGTETARLTGLSVVQLQNDKGLVLTSNHNPNEYGRLEGALARVPENVFSSAKPVLRSTRFPDGEKPTLVRLKRILLDGNEYFFTAGVIIDDQLWDQLTPAPDFKLCLEAFEESDIACSELTIEEQSHTSVYRIELLHLDVRSGATKTTAIAVRHAKVALTKLLKDLDRWLLIVLGAILGLGMLSMIWVSRKISDPLSDLVYRTSRIDLNKLNVSFKSGRKDEIGDLARVLDEMTRRLRTSRTTLQEAERKMAIGELARQVNHDIKNGLTPIRNIIKHFTQAAREDDPALPGIVLERKASLEASIQFLEDMAGNYARLSPESVCTEFELNGVLSNLLSDYARSRFVEIPFEPGQPATVVLDELALKRVIENLLDNAFDSIVDGGIVRAWTELAEESVRIMISDTGSGMDTDEVEHAFKDFHTTKTKGTGLGLSIVRRLIMDMNGSISIDSARGKGTTITLSVPTVDQH
jgi:signal transduction histidine kinase